MILIKYIKLYHNMDELYECENDCGFKGSLIQVTEHEKTCKFISSKSS